MTGEEVEEVEAGRPPDAGKPEAEEQEERLRAMIRFLQEESSLYRQLLEVAKEKQRVLVEGRFQSLGQVLEKEQKILRTVVGVEEERYALQCDLARLYGYSPGELTVSRLAETAGKYGVALREKQRELTGIIQELSLVNQSNSELIQQSLAYIDFTLETLKGPSLSYDRRGKKRRGGSSSRFFNLSG